MSWYIFIACDNPWTQYNFLLSFLGSKAYNLVFKLTLQWIISKYQRFYIGKWNRKASITQSSKSLFTYVFIFQMKEEILSAQQQLRTLCGQLRQHDRRQRRNSSDSGHGGGPSSRYVQILKWIWGKINWLFLKQNVV